jgi:hypothetical protein
MEKKSEAVTKREKNKKRKREKEDGEKPGTR